MNKINQQKIATILKVSQATASKYLTQKLSIKLVDALFVSSELKVPVEIFTDKETQLKIFGKSYIKTIPNPQAENKVCKEKE